MVKQLAAIKLRSIWNGLKSQTWVLVLSILGYLYGLFVVGALCISLLVAMGTRFAMGPDLMVAAGALATLAWIVVPVLMASQEGTLDPPRLTPYVSSSTRLAIALVLVTGVGVAGIYFLIFALTQVIGWAITGSIPAIVMAVVGVLLGIAVSWIWTRAVGAWAGRRNDSSRAGRDRAALLAAAFLFIGLAPMGIWLPLVMERLGTTAWSDILGTLKWTPFGAPWALPQAAAAGEWGNLAIQLAISLATVALGWWFWMRQLSPAMTGTRAKLSAQALEAVAEGRHLVDPSADSKAEKTAHTSKSHGAPRFLPGVDRWTKLGASSPTAAIAERTRLYWLRDPRLSMQLFGVIIIVVMAVLFSKVLFGSMSEAGVPQEFSGGFGVGMLMLSSFTYGMVNGTLLQYDSTALWIEVAIGTKGRHDRLGRLLGSLLLSLAITLISVVAFGAFTGLAPLEYFYLFSAMFVTLGSATAVATVIGSQWIYPVQPPGTSPMSSKGTGQFLTTMIIGMVQFALGFVIAAIPLGLLAWGFFSNAGWTSIAAVFALLWGVGIAVGGALIGGKIFDRTQVELLTKISAWPGHGVKV